MHAILLIDDLRTFRQEVPARIARTSAAGVQALQEAHAAGHTWDQVWLDHDLGDGTGAIDDIAPVIDWLCERAGEGQPARMSEILVHTSNGPGAERMCRVLTAAGYQVRRVPASPYLRFAGSASH